MSNPEENNKAHRWFAIECNNAAWALTDKVNRSKVETERMIHLAHASAFHWGEIGTQENVAKTWSLLGQAHAHAGNAELALHYAKLNMEYVEKRDAPKWEQGFANLILSNANVAAGNTELGAKYYNDAVEIGEEIDDAEDKAVLEGSMRNALGGRVKKELRKN